MGIFKTKIRLILILIVLTLCVSLNTVAYSYEIGTPTGSVFDIFGYITNVRFAGQTFVCQEPNNTITGAILYLGTKQGSPSTMVAELWYNDFQQGQLLNTKAITASGINASAFNYFIFDTPTNCENTMQYTFKFYCDGCPSGAAYDMHTRTPSSYSGGYVLYVGNSLNSTYDNRTTHDLVMNITYTQDVTPGVKPSLTLYSNLVNNTLIDYSPFYVVFNGTSVNNSLTYNCNIFLDNELIYSDSISNISKNTEIALNSPLNINQFLDLDLDCYNENASKNLTYILDFDTVAIYGNVILLSINDTQNANMQSLTEYTNKIYEVLSMIGFIILWLGLWIFGYHALQTKNELLGGTMIVLTVPLDFYFAYAFRESLMLGTGILGIAFEIMCAWTFGVFILIRRSVRKQAGY